MRKRGVFLLLLFLAPLAVLRAQSPRTLQADFTRFVKSPGSTEMVRGTLFFKAPDRVILVVREPVSQWVVFETGSMLLWYPGSGKAWRFSQKKPQALSFASMFVGVPKTDFGLAGAGFTLAGSESREGALVTRWKPPQSLARTVGGASVGVLDRRPCTLELTDPKGGLLARVAYTEFVSFDSQAIPSHIQMTQKGGAAMISEEVLFTGHVFNAELPSDVDRFRLPAGVVAKEAEW